MSHNRIELSIIIVNYYSEELVNQCVQSIIEFSALDEIQIIIVDNGSNSSILSNFKDKAIKIVKNRKNEGFGAACNLGVEASKSEYLLFLNPDTKVFKNSLSKAISVIKEKPEITVLGCKQIDENKITHRSCARYLTVNRYINKLLKLNILFPNVFKGVHMSDWDHESSKYVDHVIGAFYLIRRKDFLESNGFSKDYFVYYEDLDLSKRIVDNGGKIYYDSTIEIFHQGGGASESVKAERLFYSLDSILIFSKKHLSCFKYVIMFIIIIFIEPLLRLFSEMIKLDLKGFFEVFKSYKLLYIKRFGFANR
ncbi:glycosyltransferase family 2 protein [Lacinutrix sp.]|uniref:glycosyltransferase family 2 protein n=1 Tax=Lacinutrix sp. TaxID=1937692 RepID=UPI00260C169C|nr:glycosyltransferase family 2 protein [Lacinutrix sp.]MDG1715025.1 glycosyltransferase family 2 protein [Lacinutrix sp.]